MEKDAESLKPLKPTTLNYPVLSDFVAVFRGVDAATLAGRRSTLREYVRRGVLLDTTGPDVYE